MAPAQTRLRAAHAPGPAFLSYTPNGDKLVTVGVNNTIRVFQTGSDGEPINIDDCHESNNAVAAANEFFVSGSEDGSVSKYSLQTYKLDQVLVRSSLPIRDLAISPDAEWVAVASDELEIKIVNATDPLRLLYIRDLEKSPKHLSFDTTGSILSVSLTSGVICIYSLSTENPRLLKTISNVVNAAESDEEASLKAVWHQDGRAFAVPGRDQDIQIVSRRNWIPEGSFDNGHLGAITALCWSPNGAMLATAGQDKKICLWDVHAQKIISSILDVRHTVLACTWHPTENILCYTTNEGELFIHMEVVPEQYLHLVTATMRPSPFISKPLAEISGNAQAVPIVQEKRPKNARPRRGTPDSLDEIFASADGEYDGFVEDDDGLGYAEVNLYGKRARATLDGPEIPSGKRRAIYDDQDWQLHEPFQPGSTPWKGSRRYLCLNLIGFVWAVDQETHNTVTVEFYDREAHRDFHFTDILKYDKACLNVKGALFSCQATEHQPATMHYRPHETWTTRADWRIQLPENEDIVSISLSDSFIVATTTNNYVRMYTLFGVPFRVYRQKSFPAITCTSWRDYVLTLGNGSSNCNGFTCVNYTIENIKRDEIYQCEDVVALTEGSTVQNVFFSDAGDPFIYDSEGVLLVLEHWRTSGQARWVPVLDTKQLDRLREGKKEETYWPVAVAGEKFYCIILKGGDTQPYFPRPLITEFEFQMPLGRPAISRESDDQAPTESQQLEEVFLRTSLHLSLLEDLTSATNATHEQKLSLNQKQLEVDKILLQLLASECIEGEEKGMKALEIVELIRDRSGRMLDAAGKVAARFGRDVLGEKIRELAEKRLIGLDDDDAL